VSAPVRLDPLQRLAGLEPQADVDVLILGGGINGAGLYRDLCEQGLRCLIVDNRDFGSGTSAAPSRLIHGGLKYLETGELGLVAQSTLERNLLLKNAPHRVRPLQTVIPIFSWLRGIPAAVRTLFGSVTAPRARGAALIKLGLSMYDFYGSRDRTLPRHRLLRRRRALSWLPALTPDIVAVGVYHDAMIVNPERLVLELVMDGLRASPVSLAANHAALDSVTDGVLDFHRADGTRFSVRPRIVVNAAGPWIDGVNATLGEKSELIGGTKGSHLLLRNEALVRQLDGRMIYFEADDGRICLVFDYEGLALIGSTDIPADDPDTVHCDDEEIDYLLHSVSGLLPGVDVAREQIVHVYSGIRPLPNSAADLPGLISRDHSAPVLEPTATRAWPIVCLVGGKWTTFRGFAEEVSDTLLSRLSRRRLTSTRSLPIGGGRDFPVTPPERRRWLDEQAARVPVSRERLDTLLRRYGTQALDIANARIAGRPDEQRLPDATTWSTAEIAWMARRELVGTLCDVVSRRTDLAITGALTRADLACMAAVLAEELHWNASRRRSEVDATLDELQGRHLMRLGDGTPLQHQ